jgi:hypothetical protein
MENKSLTPEEIKIIEKNLDDQEWRLNNLYYITDEQGREVLFKMNVVQRFLYAHRWFKNIILKSRQHGITTFIDILFLDEVLFRPNQTALIIAHTINDAQKIFDTKIKFAFDHLPEWLRSRYDVDTNNKNQLKFLTNGSSISVAVSGRSGTFQYLHISELGAIDYKYPERSIEIRGGSLNTVHKGSMVFIESTAKGRSGLFFEFCNRAMNLFRAKTELTEMDYKFFFFPWWQDMKYVLDIPVLITKEMDEYFMMLKDVHKIELTDQQKWWYVKKKEEQKDEMFAEFPSYPEEAFTASLEGAYYNKELTKAIVQKRVTTVPFDPSLPVYTFWDLGVNDEMEILFLQIFGPQARIIDQYNNSGEGFSHYASILQEKQTKLRYRYAGHYAPHDITVRNLGEFATTRKQEAAKCGINFRVVKRHSIDVGINLGRELFNMLWIDEKNCSRFVSAAQEYRKEWDEVHGIWKSQPLHNWASHVMDAYRMFAVEAKGLVGSFQISDDKKRDDDDWDYYNQDIEEDIGGSEFNPIGRNF